MRSCDGVLILCDTLIIDTRYIENQYTESYKNHCIMSSNIIIININFTINLINYHRAAVKNIITYIVFVGTNYLYAYQ